MQPGERLVLAVDIGTSSIKVGTISESGRLIESGREHILNHYADVRRWSAYWWTDALARILSSMPTAQEVSAVAVSGNGPTIVAVGPTERVTSSGRTGGAAEDLDAAANAESGAEEGLPYRSLDPVLLWLDGRDAALQGERSFFLPKIAWLARHEPGRHAEAAWFISGPEYIDYVLTGEVVTITPTEEFKPYIWDHHAADRYGIDAAKLPPFVRVGEVIGRVREVAAEVFALPPGVPVVAGGSDFIVSLLGTGAVTPGVTSDRAGTSEGVNYCSAAPVDDPRTRCLPHPVAGLYNVAGVLSSTGTIFEWFREISGQKGRSYADMLGEIRDVADSVHVPWFFPSLHEGAAWEFSRGMFIDLGAEHGPREMGRAVVESIGYAVREVVEVLEQNDCRVEELRVCGGQGRNAVWSQMKANMIGRSLAVVEVIDAELLGNACAAFVGIGVYGNIVEASRAMVRISRRYEPVPERLGPYEERYHRYREAYGRFRLALKECDLL
jgi:xylulokinase